MGKVFQLQIDYDLSIIHPLPETIMSYYQEQLSQNTMICIQENEFEYVVYKRVILPCP